MVPKPGKFQFAIDRGGTFTDVFARCPDGKIKVLKLLSVDPQNYKDAPTEGIRRILQEMHTRFQTSIVDGDTLMEQRKLMKKIEYAQTIRQIMNFAAFLPNEMLQLRMDDMDKAISYVGVVLCAEIGGFVQLSDKYNKVGIGGMDRLTATLNAYIGAIVESVHFYGGDVLKFCGETIVSQWKVLPHESLVEILHEVVCCALFIQSTFGNFATEANVHLNLKISISCGNMSFFVVGDNSRKSYTVAGDVANEIMVVLEQIQLGEVAISNGTWAHMLQERYETTTTQSGSVVKVSKVAYKANEANLQIVQEDKINDLKKLVQKHLRHRKLMHKMKKFESYHTDATTRAEFIRSLPSRPLVKVAPKNWTDKELRLFVVKPVLEQIAESQPVEYLTEMQEACIQIISIQPSSYFEPIYIPMLNAAFQIVCHICGRNGIITTIYALQRHVIIELVYGLKGKTNGTEFQSALKTAYNAKIELLKIEGIMGVSAAVTNSFVYSGVVGHPMRKDYTVIGAGVILANRMVLQFENKISCDFKTFKYSKLSSFYFQVVQYGTKGMSNEDSGIVFEYSESFENPAETLITKIPIIGRASEFNIIRNIVYSPGIINRYGVCFVGAHKMGKTGLLQRAMRSYKRTQGVTVVSITLESSSNIPYHCISNLYRQLYDSRATVNSLDIEYILALPRDLFDVYEMSLSDEDAAMQKFRLLTHFRDMTQFAKEHITVIFIDNVDHIDKQSWEILELVLLNKNIRLIMAGAFDLQDSWDFKLSISLKKDIQFMELQPISRKCVAIMACQFLGVSGISKTLTKLLILSSEGRPGYIQSSLLRVINNGCIDLNLINKKDRDFQNFIYPSAKYRPNPDAQIITVVKYSEAHKMTLAEFTIERISLDLFESFTPYEQLVIKTGAVLGNIFTRMLLVAALKYPTESILAKVICHLFNQEVFECGSRYIYNVTLESNPYCCRCYFEDDFFNETYERFLPKYAYCKIIHFRNKGIREVAYNVLPCNQRKELHLLCTDILEIINNKCPSCLRQTVTHVFSIGKFKDVYIYCNNLTTQKPAAMEEISTEEIKQVIRDLIRIDVAGEEKPKFKPKQLRPIFDPKLCNCYEILLRVYTDLIYHSERAGHLAKRIYFTMQYGFLLVSLKTLSAAISFLTKARELCMINANSQESGISETFRKMHVGKIQVGLAKACIDLRQFKSARNHLAVAVRQYNIPSVALTFKAFSIFVTRKFLLNAWINRPPSCKDIIARQDMGSCLSLCSKLFYLEGKIKMAKLTAAYSIYLIQTANPNINVLLEAYCNAIDIHQYALDNHTCEKLSKNIGKEILQRYANNIIYNVYSLRTVVNTLFVQNILSGNIVKAIRLGYRLIDICQNFFSTLKHFEMSIWLVLLLMCNYRIAESASICRAIYKFKSSIVNNTLIYYSSVLQVYLHTTFTVETISNILDYAREFIRYRPKKLNWEDYYFLTLLHLYYVRNKNYIDAEEFRVIIPFNDCNIRREITFKTLIAMIEAKIHLYLRNKRLHMSKIVENSNYIVKLLKFMKLGVMIFKIYIPLYYCLSAWWCMIGKRIRKANKYLNVAEKIAVEQDNYLFQCLVKQLRRLWSGGYMPPSILNFIHFKNATEFSLEEWSQLLYPFPLEV